MDSQPSVAPVRERRALQSWKEIADYLGVTTRTAQRWHRDDGLPVHHLGGGPKARVAANSDELDRWGADQIHRSPDRQAPGGKLEVRLRRWRIATVVIGMPLLVLTAALLYRTYFYSGVPSRAVMEGSTLAIYDVQGRLCWNRAFPEITPDAYLPMSNAAFRTAIPAQFDTSLIDDIDGDGKVEVVFNYWPRTFPDAAGRLLCYEANGKLRWQFVFGRKRTLNGRDLGTNYRGVFIRRARAHGKPWIVAISHHDPGFPAQAAVLDPRTGNLHQEYWNPGWITVTRVIDLDGDGSDEILLAGYNNPGPGPGHAGLVALRIGAQPPPLAPERVDDLAGFSGGGEMAYFLFPRSDLVDAEGIVPYVDVLEVFEKDRILARTQGPQHATIVYYFDFRLQLLRSALDDGFASVHEQWRRRGALDHALSPIEAAELGKVQVFERTPNGNDSSVHSFWRLR